MSWEENKEEQGVRHKKRCEQRKNVMGRKRKIRVRHRTKFSEQMKNNEGCHLTRHRTVGQLMAARKTKFFITVTLILCQFFWFLLILSFMISFTPNLIK